MQTVYDAAVILEAISGCAGAYTNGLEHCQRLDGVRLLVPTNLIDWTSEVLQAEQRQCFNAGCQILRDLGAELVEVSLSEELIRYDRDPDMRLPVWEPEFVVEIRRYFNSLKQ